MSRATKGSTLQPNLVEVPVAYPVARGDQELAQFMTSWIEIKKGDGTLDCCWTNSPDFRVGYKRRSDAS